MDVDRTEAPRTCTLSFLLFVNRHTLVSDCRDALKCHKSKCGKSMGVFSGAGGIGFDVAEYITHDASSHSTDPVDAFAKEWGIDMTNTARGTRFGQVGCRAADLHTEYFGCFFGVFFLLDILKTSFKT
jgi:hypothetical protein